MNILFLPIHYYLSDKYGSEPSWGVEVMKRLARRGHKIFAVTGRADLSQELGPDIKLFVMDRSVRPKNTLVELFNKLRFHFFYYFTARKILREERIDVIHHFAPVSFNSFNLFFLLSKKTLPWIMGPAMPPAKTFSKNEFTQWLGTEDNFWARMGEIITKLISPVFSFLTQRTLVKVNRLICVTEEAEQCYQNLIDKSQIKVIPIGIDTQKFSNLSEDKRDSKDTTIHILAVAYLIKRKGIDLLIKALQQLLTRDGPLLKLMIVGSGPEKKNLEKLVENLGLQKRVSFIGFVPHNKVAEFYAGADIFVSPTLYEPYGQTILEAMAVGLPVVASRVGGIPTMVTKEIGILFEPGNIEELSEALTKLSTDKNLYETMSQGAQKRAHEVFDWEKIVSRYERLYS